MKFSGKLFIAFIALFLIVSPACKRKPEKIPPGAENVTVTFTSPTGEVARPNSVVATFNSPMVSISTIGKINSKGPLEITPNVAGQFHWLGTQTVSFVPEKPFPYATKFSVKVKDDVTNIHNGRLKEPVSWEFETARPVLESSKPYNGAKQVSLNENILLDFNQPVDPDVVNKHLKVIATNEKGEARQIQTNAKRPPEKLWTEEWNKDLINIDEGVIISPIGKLPFNSKIELTLDAELKGSEGELTANKPQIISFDTYGPLKIERISCTKKCNPLSPIDIEFSNEIKPKDAIKKITIKPEIEIENDSEWDTSYFSIYGKFKPATQYEITLSPDLTDIFGNKLGNVEKITYVTDNYAPRISMVNGYGVVEAKGPTEIPVEIMNLATLKIRRKTISTNEIIPLISKYGVYSPDELEGVFTPENETVINPTSPLNTAETIPISLSETLGESGKGVILVDVYSPQIFDEYDNKKHYIHNNTLLQVTDIGITGKFSNDGVLIWATSLASGAPIEGAKVEIRNKQNKVLWSGTTDEKGVAFTKLKKPDSESEDGESYSTFYAFVEKDGDFAFSMSDWSQGFYAWDFGYWQIYEEDTMRGYLFTERGIYKPGETVHLKAIIRDISGNGLSAPKKSKALVYATDSRNVKYFEEEAGLSDNGTLNTDVKIPAYAATGGSTINVRLTMGNDKDKNHKYFNTRIEIADYKPAEFKIDITPSSRDYVAGDDIDVKVKADYLFGEPMKDSNINWDVYRRSETFMPKDLERYAFGPGYFEEEKTDEFGLMDLKGRSRGTLDNEGKINIEIPTKVGSVTRTTGYVVETEVEDINKKSISNRTVVTVHPGEYYLGISTDSFLNKAGTPFETQIVSADIEGKIIKGKKADVKLLKREWHTAKKKAVVGYTYETKAVDTEVGSCKIVTAEEPVKCTVTPNSSGMHILKAASTDGKGNPVVSTLGIYVTGQGEAAWKPEAHDRIELIADKKEYAPGETAKIMVQSPFNTAEALITYEREGIIKQETFILNGYAPTLTIPITEKFIPNIYLSVVLVKGRISEELSEAGIDEGRPRVKVGYLNLPVSAESKKLKVTVTTDKKTASPGDEIKASFKVVDHAGNPVKSELTVMAVDTGSLILTDYKTPNPFDYFYAESGLGVETSDSRIHIVGRRSYGEKGEPTGGGGGADDILYRKKFLPVAYWNPSVATNDAGEANISFELPDNLTTFKVMAVANTIDRFGNGDSEVISRKPFMMRTALPYFAAVGDEFKAGVVVHNYTEGTLSGTIFAKAENIELKGKDAENFKIDAKEKKEVFFKFKAKKAGKAILSFNANTEAGSDGLQVPLEIKVTRPIETFTSYGESEASAKEKLDPLEDVYPDIGGLEMSAASTAMTGLTDGSLYLIKYPYECLEQKSSRAIGMIIYKQIADALKIDDKDIETYKDKIQEILYALYNFQNWDGGFGMWPKLQPDPYISIYATHMMVLAGANGYNVPQNILNKAKNYLKNMLRWDANEKRYNKDYLNSLKAYALYVLSLAGEPETAYHENLYSVRETLTPDARAQLMMAVKASGGSSAQMQDFIQYVNNLLVVTPGEAYVKDSGVSYGMKNDYYTDAYILLALLKIEPNHPMLPKMARYLMASSKKGYWTSTHSTAAVLTSLYDYYKTKESTPPDYTVEFKLGQKVISKAEFEEGDVVEKSAKIAMQDLIKLKQATELVFQKDGPGMMYYKTRLAYASSATPLPPMEEGFTIFKEIKHYDKKKSGKDFSRGDVAVVHLEFVLPDARRYVVINDWLPAGLEAVNFSLATAKQSLMQDMPLKFNLDHVEIYGDRVLIFADALPAGTYQFDYFAKVSTKGEFTVPPAQIEEMYNPEVFGRSTTDEIEIE